MYDFWGNEIKRFFQLETLQFATDRQLQHGDRFILPSLLDALGPGEITSLSFELFQEGRFQLIFRLKVHTSKDRTAQFAFVVAKNHEECSMIARNEHGNLLMMHERMPEHVVKPYRGGPIFLPDRQGRKEGREIFAYITQWLTGYEELGVNKNLQFIENVKNRHVFSIAETEELKVQMVEIIARSYDPLTHSAMTMPEIASGDFVVYRAGRGHLKIKLIASRRIMLRASPVKLIDRMLDASWDWGGQRLRLAPLAPEDFLEGLTRALGKDTAKKWVAQYLGAVAAKKVPPRRAEYVTAWSDFVR